MAASESGSRSSARVAVFIDWQNCYRSAREAFGFSGPGIPGNVRPLPLARYLVGRSAPGASLTRLRIYTGRASQRRDPRTYAANRRQFQAWSSSAPNTVEVIARTLDYSLGRPREKGVDVALAIDLVRTTLFEDEHDVALLVSADTDLLPALELVVQRAGPSAIEVAAWAGPHWSPKPLSLAGSRIRQHILDRACYERFADATDYNVDVRMQGASPPFGRRPRDG